MRFGCRARLPLRDGLGGLGGLRGRLAGVEAEDDGVAPWPQELGGASRRGYPDAGAGMLSCEAEEQPGADCCESLHHGAAIRMDVMECVDGDFEDEVEFGWSQFEDGAATVARVRLGPTTVLILVFISKFRILMHSVY